MTEPESMQTIGAPNGKAPNMEAPNVKAHNLQAPDMEAPDLQAPNMQAPDVTTRNTTAQRLESPAALHGIPLPASAEPPPYDPQEVALPERRRAPLAPGLYLVATPIGNLEDMTLRGLRVLREADRIACEDTRQTAKLLHHFGITTPVVSYHLHNERGRAEELVTLLQAGQRIAVVSDAGMPGIADPGEAIVAAAIAAGVPVFAVPGANAALGALVSSGLSTERFTFRGFLPSKAGERRTALETVRAEMSGEATTQVFYETPHRIVDALADVAAVFGPGHRVVLARELTKMHEEMLRGTAEEVRAVLLARDSVRGEMVLLLDGTVAASETAGGSIAEAVRALMKTDGLDEGDALKRVARERGIGKSEAYREWQRAKKR